MPEAILTLLLFLNPFLPISSLILLPVWMYTLMQTDINIQSHWWPVRCLLGICASSFPLFSLLLLHNGDKWLDYTLTSDTNDLTCHCSCLPLRFGDWPLDKTSLAEHDLDFVNSSAFAKANWAWLMLQTCQEIPFILLHLFFYITGSLTSFCTFHPPPFTQEWF